MESHQRYEQELVATLYRMIDHIKAGSLVVSSYDSDLTAHRSERAVTDDYEVKQATATHRQFEFRLNGVYVRKPHG